jgi:hypothetical protein
MRVIVVGASAFPTFIADRATAVVRIYDPVEDWHRDAAHQAGRGWGRFLPLEFWDASRFAPGRAERLILALLGHHRPLCLAAGRRLFGARGPWRPFLAADADDIVAFADGLEAAGIRDIVVVCSNGRARSWTVGCWIARHLGLDLPATQGWQHACPHIERMLDRVGGPPHGESRPTKPAFGH